MQAQSHHRVPYAIIGPADIRFALSRKAIGDPAKRERLLGLMAGECCRLTRFLTNVLDFGKIVGDSKVVRQAVLNLLDNALKYSPERKEVIVSLTDGPGQAAIAVEDRGMGIEPEDREKIFEAFFRSRPAVEQDPAGVGLGLKIVRHIMDAHSGRVEVESEPGKGSVFRLVFPRQEGVKP